MELTTEKLGEYLSCFLTYTRPRLQRYLDYYMGNQKIHQKVIKGANGEIDDTKPCNKIVTNFCENIVENYRGYLTGQEVSYTSNQDITDILDVLNYNDYAQQDNELMKQALIYGLGYEIEFIDEDNQYRFQVLDSRETFCIYANTLTQDLLYGVRFYPVRTLVTNTDGFFVEVYSKDKVTIYKSDNLMSQFSLIDVYPHYFGQVPFTVLAINPEEVSIFDKVIDLQDSYNTLLSSSIDDYEAFCDGYMVFRGTIPDADEVYNMKKNRTIFIGVDEDLEWLQRALPNSQMEQLENIAAKIHETSASPDFSDEAFGTASGVAMQYKLLGFENKAQTIAKQLVKALQKRIELISNILTLTNSDTLWRDINITVQRNLPTDLTEKASIVNTLRGLVSDQTLLAQLPFVSDVQQEMEAIKKQEEENMENYSFNMRQEEAEEDEE